MTRSEPHPQKIPFINIEITLFLKDIDYAKKNPKTKMIKMTKVVTIKKGHLLLNFTITKKIRFPKLQLITLRKKKEIKV